MNQLNSQNDVILNFLKRGNVITPLEALHLCGCFRLAARIYDLKERGYKIESTMVEFDDSRVAQYWLANY